MLEIPDQPRPAPLARCAESNPHVGPVQVAVDYFLKLGGFRRPPRRTCQFPVCASHPHGRRRPRPDRVRSSIAVVHASCDKDIHCPETPRCGTLNSSFSSIFQTNSPRPDFIMADIVWIENAHPLELI
ncbi:hypothetical protein Zmor_004697 [Zophobas morio]|uniref:Uncharacterized protein n=1 Tax=Zophobas morio TaxID=2755281 RepID=A0AA38ING2_9CUCU|nr:hypothetical protein Zmor_004697 [Zophobas morio]